MSLGRCYAGHSLEHKLSMAAKHGLQGIELFYEDLADLAHPQTPSNLLSAATYVRSLCTSLNLDRQPSRSHTISMSPTRESDQLSLDVAPTSIFFELPPELRQSVVEYVCI